MKTVTTAEDVERFRADWVVSGLPEDALTPLGGLDAADVLQDIGEFLARLVPARYEELVTEAKLLGSKELQGVRSRAGAWARGVAGAWRSLRGLERRREALHRVLVGLRRAGAIPDQPAREAAIARTMETHARSMW